MSNYLWIIKSDNNKIEYYGDKLSEIEYFKKFIKTVDGKAIITGENETSNETDFVRKIEIEIPNKYLNVAKYIIDSPCGNSCTETYKLLVEMKEQKYIDSMSKTLNIHGTYVYTCVFFDNLIELKQKLMTKGELASAIANFIYNYCRDKEMKKYKLSAKQVDNSVCWRSPHKQNFDVYKTALKSMTKKELFNYLVKNDDFNYKYDRLDRHDHKINSILVVILTCVVIFLLIAVGFTLHKCK